MLVGRESERRVIMSLLAGARVGDSRVLVLSGEPGIGKTALLAEAETLVGDMHVLRAEGIESERLVPFAGLLQLVRPLLPLLSSIPAPQSAALSSALLLSSPGRTEPSRFAVGAATLSLLSRAAEDRPLALLVDDAHLLDQASAEALVFAARRLVSDPVAILVGIRAGEPSAAAWDTLPGLWVSGVDLDAAQELVSVAFGPVAPEQLNRLHEATAGNPLALLELGGRVDSIALLPPDSPLAISEQLSRSFLGRLEGLSAPARAALVVAAADSASALTIQQACLALDIGEPRLAEAADAGLITLRGDQVDFRHPLVRSAVYGTADPHTRRAVHRALAEVVPRHETDRLAWHLSESAVAPDEATAGTLEQVGAQASARGAHGIATSAYERAANLTWDRSNLARRLASAGEAAWMSGLTERALSLLDRAIECRPDPVLRAHVQEVRGAVETRSGSLDTALATLTDAAQAVESTDPDLAVRLFSDAIHVTFYLAETTAAVRACAAIEALLDSCSDPNAWFLGTMATGMAQVLSGSGRSGIQRLREAVFRLATPDVVPDDRFRLPLRLQGALWLRDSGPHRQVINDAVDRMREQAALGSLPYLLMHIARDAATSDRWDDAEAAYTEGIRLSRETGQSTDLAVSLAGLACLNARRGRVQDCQEGVAAAHDLCAANHIRLGSFWLTFAQGDLASGLGDLTTAASHYEALESQLTDTAFADPDQSCAPELVETLVHLSRGEDARRVAEEFASKADAKGQPWSLARASRAFALCGPDLEAERHFRAALELHALTPDVYETARTELSFGGWLRRKRRRAEARPFLRSALRAFEGLGAEPWADRSALELEATGETANRTGANVMDELTPQERQIAQMLATGRTTRETAAALFLSPKTVEYHLRHVYLKLDIRSRAALTELFAP